MNQKMFIIILAIIICVLVVMGVVTLNYYNDIDAAYYRLGNQVYDFTGAINGATGMLKYIGNMGRDVLLRLNITDTRNHDIYMRTYTDGNGKYAYILYWRQEYKYGDINGNGPITTIKQFYNRIYAYQDYDNSTRLKTLINNNYMYIFPSENDKIYKHDNINDLSIQYTILLRMQEINIEVNGTTYTYVDDVKFDMTTFSEYNFTEVN